MNRRLASPAIAPWGRRRLAGIATQGRSHMPAGRWRTQDSSTPRPPVRNSGRPHNPSCSKNPRYETGTEHVLCSPATYAIPGHSDSAAA
ncbi:MAG: hypothetical protein QF437_17835, partial [Planctomycetota bacterium]|nr:hypothetical protein [Planctomycetota bacterium]